MNIRKLLLIVTVAMTSLAGHGQTSLRIAMPWVFSGYRQNGIRWSLDTVIRPTRAMWSHVNDSVSRSKVSMDAIDYAEMLLRSDTTAFTEHADTVAPAMVGNFDPEHPLGPATPYWLDRAIRERDFADNFIYSNMVKDPYCIDYAEWKLPVPPKLPKDDYSFRGFIRNLELPVPHVPGNGITPRGEIGQINWLHTCNIALQLSQAYISQNWYQGGSDYLAIFANFLWDVTLNPVYHPKLMFQSTLSYKLAINSTLQDQFHKYAVSQELFQYNLKFGYKAAKNWFYSMTALFKTQFLNSYPSDSETRTASFLSPATLNLGLGMTYSYTKPNKKLSFTASIAPVSYNLTTCIDRLVDHAQFGMLPDQRINNEFGSNAEVNFYWALRDNISYKTRLFLFTDYSNFVGDWENTLNFQWSKLFSTQLYFYFRYDTAADTSKGSRWGKWMLKEILSFGLSYTFSTKG